MATMDHKTALHGYLKTGRRGLLWKLDGLSEYDVRRPLVPSGTNLLGLVKHLAGVEHGYFGETFGRDPGVELPFDFESTEPNIDMWATPDESREYILGVYRDVCEFADRTIEDLSIDAIGSVPWWSGEEVTLHTILVHVATETHRHAGHADIVRELIDSSIGLREQNDNIPPEEAAWWREYYDKVEQMARTAEEATG